MGSSGLQSVHDNSPLPFLPPHTFPLLQRRSFPWAATLQELLLSGSSPPAAVLQDKPDPEWALHQPQVLSGTTLTLVSAGLFLILFSPSFLSLTLLCSVLPYVFSLLGSALCCGGSVADMAGTGCIQHGQPLVPSHAGHPWSAPTAKILA